MNAFHVCGIVLAAWALLVSFLGITRENFPGSGPAARTVSAISVILALATIASAVYTSLNEEEHGDEGGEEAALGVRI